MDPCFVRSDCPKGYTQEELRVIAKGCGLKLTRDERRGYKTKVELCSELLSLRREKEEVSARKSVPLSLQDETRLPPRRKRFGPLPPQKTVSSTYDFIVHRDFVPKITLEDIDKLEDPIYRNLERLRSFLAVRRASFDGTLVGVRIDNIMSTIKTPTSEVRRSLIQDLLHELVPDSYSSAGSSTEFIASEDQDESVSEGLPSSAEEGTISESFGEGDKASLGEKSFSLSSLSEEEGDEALSGEEITEIELSLDTELLPREKRQLQHLDFEGPTPTWDDVDALESKEYNSIQELERFLTPYYPLFRTLGRIDQIEMYLNEPDGDYRREQVQTFLSTLVREEVSEEEPNSDEEEDESREETIEENSEEEEEFALPEEDIFQDETSEEDRFADSDEEEKLSSDEEAL